MDNKAFEFNPQAADVFTREVMAKLAINICNLTDVPAQIELGHHI